MAWPSDAGAAPLGAPPAGRERRAVVGMAPPRHAGVAVPVGPDLVARTTRTDRRDGDLAVDGEQVALEARRREVVDRPWVWLRQVHGADVVVLPDGDPVEAVAGSGADAVVTRRLDVALAAHSADCATIGLVGWDPRRVADLGPAPDEVAPAATGAAIGAVHAGWRGLEAGVLGRAVAAIRELGATHVEAVLGPCICVGCYEFGDDDLARVVAAVGPAAAGRTRGGRPALDLRLGVRTALAALDVHVRSVDDRCTACTTTAAGALTRPPLDAHRLAYDQTGAPVPQIDPGDGRGPDLGAVDRRSVPALFSHRARGDTGRQALVVWLERPSLGSRP